jgi:hypothetical protein
VKAESQEGDMSELAVLKAHKTNKVLPPGYNLDHDPAVAVLRRMDGSVVAYFPMWTFEPMHALEEAEADLILEKYPVMGWTLQDQGDNR